MPSRTTNFERNQIVTYSEIHFIIASVNPEALKLEEGATGGVQ